VSLATKYTGLILASGALDGVPTHSLLEVLSPFKIRILDSSLLTIRDRFIFSLLIELSPDHQEAIASDLDALTALGKVDVAYDFTAFALAPRIGRPFSLALVSSEITPSTLLRFTKEISKVGVISELKTTHEESFIVSKINFTSQSGVEILREAISLIAKEEKISASLIETDVMTIGNEACLFDMDSTFINEEVIDVLAKIAGVGFEVAEITERAMTGELDFEQSLRARVALLKDQPISIIEEARAQITFTTGAIEFVNALHKRGAKVGIVSGGFHDVIDEFLKPLNLELVQANRFEIVEGKLTGEIQGNVVDRTAKRMALQSFGDGASRTFAIGDGANDIEMIESADIGIAFMAKPTLIEAANTALFVRDLRAILPLLGY
jgi:phosphoserine phosphatase